MLDLIIITGASRGIGANILRSCRSQAKKFICISTSGKVDQELINDHNVYSLAVDLANYNEVGTKLLGVIDQIEPISSMGIVLCGASLGEAGGLQNSDLSTWDNLFRSNVLGNLAVFREVLKFSAAETLIRGVFFAGGGAAYGYPDFSAYALTKVAIVRAVENLSLETKERFKNFSVVALAPGAVATGMLDEVLKHGGVIKTRTDISEPTLFVSDFLNDKIPSISINGCFIHVRDDLMTCQEKLLNSSHFKLRRVE